MKRKVATTISVVMLIGLIFFNACSSKKLEINLTEEPIIFDQSIEAFEPEMLSDYVSLKFGEKNIDLSHLSLDESVDLRDTGEYSVTLRAHYKNKEVAVPTTITVIDREAPMLIIPDEEVLIYKGENVKLDPDYFFMNAYDGVNGLINNRIELKGSVNFKKVGKYRINVSVKDKSGNEAEEVINIRVTDNIDEMAKYLYDRSTKFFHGDYFVHEDLNKNKPILNLNQGKVLLTDSQLEHFKWLSGINGEYNNEQSGVKLTVTDKDQIISDTSKHKHIKAYKDTKLELQNKSDDYRHYNAVSFYKDTNEKNADKDKENKYIRKYIIKKVDGRWLVDEFYLPY